MGDSETTHRFEGELPEYDKTTSEDLHREIDDLNELAWALRDTDLQRAQSMAENARALSRSLGSSSVSYDLGLAESLRSLGYLDFRLGNYPRSFSQSLEARQLFESLEHLEGLSDALDIIASVYAGIGNLPDALAATYKQLDAAERARDKKRIANAYNNLAHLYIESDRPDDAIEACHQNLRLATESAYHRNEFLGYANLAISYLQKGEPLTALEHATTALPISRDAGFELFEVYTLNILAEAHLKLEHVANALAYLVQALTLSEHLDAKPVAIQVLSNIAQAHRQQEDFDHALEVLDRGIALAKSIDGKPELVKLHLLASEITEQQGDFATALSHYKQYQGQQAAVLGERADQQLQILQVAHETENAKRQAEVLKQKAKTLQEAHDLLERRVEERTTDLNHTVELLQEEIDERRRVEVELQRLTENLEDRLIARTRELAAFFDLATLNRSGDDFTQILSPAITQILSTGQCHAFCLHLYDSDLQSLQLVTADGLSPRRLSSLQAVPITEPFVTHFHQDGGHWSTTDLRQAELLPEAFKLSGFQSYLGTQLRTQGRTLGWLSCYRRVETNFSLDEISLMVALAEQLAVIIENHRLREQAEAMAVLEERQRLARDLHDSVNQSLYGLTLLARSGAEAAAEDNVDRLQTSLADLETSAFQALREMRLLLFQLRPQALDQVGLVEALMLRLNTIERRSGMTATYEGVDALALPSATEAELYHLAMEALNNALKHAQANHVAVRITVENDQLILAISDDGRGFDLSETSGGLGLQSIRERAAALNAQLAITAEADGGTQIEVCLPVNHSEEER